MSTREANEILIRIKENNCHITMDLNSTPAQINMLKNMLSNLGPNGNYFIIYRTILNLIYLL